MLDMFVFVSSGQLNVLKKNGHGNMPVSQSEALTQLTAKAQAHVKTWYSLKKSANGLISAAKTKKAKPAAEAVGSSAATAAGA